MTREDRFIEWLRTEKKGAPASECVRKFRGISLRSLQAAGRIVFRIGKRCGDRWFVKK